MSHKVNPCVLGNTKITQTLTNSCDFRGVSLTGGIHSRLNKNIKKARPFFCAGKVFSNRERNRESRGEKGKEGKRKRNETRGSPPLKRPPPSRKHKERLKLMSKKEEMIVTIP